MPAANAIAPDKLFRLIGLPHAPALLDIRTPEAMASNPDLLPGSVPRRPDRIAKWGSELRGRSAVVLGDDERDAHTAAARLRREGVAAEALEGGLAAWIESGFPLVAAARLPPRDGEGRTTWVTRTRPKVDRIACPWLVRRFVDPDAIFLFAPPSQVMNVADNLSAAPFDIDAGGVVWNHRDDLCTFDVMLADLGLSGVDGLARLAPIVRGADTARPDLAAPAAGLLAVSLGLSRMFPDDHEQLEAGMTLYDALYRWCRDGMAEVHDWVSHKPRRGGV
jgi:rhodanese-related sulfurtransferase